MKTSAKQTNFQESESSGCSVYSLAKVVGGLLFLFCAFSSPADIGVSQAEPVVAESQSTPGQVARLNDLKESIAQQYPQVTQVSIEQYLDAKTGFRLIDVRPEAEFAVSYIPGAVNISDADELLRYARLHADDQLLVYCSVGARSSAAAELLHAQGQRNVSNLAGSIFEWSNLGLELESSTGSTRKVHPYNFWWGWRYLLPINEDE